VLLSSMNNGLEVGKRINIKKGTELNHGLNEDADSIVLRKTVSAVVVSLTQLKNGGVEIEVPGHEDLSPLFLHQPEGRKRPGRLTKTMLHKGS
jgi:hypothetical protein